MGIMRGQLFRPDRMTVQCTSKAVKPQLYKQKILFLIECPLVHVYFVKSTRLYLNHTHTGVSYS